VLKWPDRDEVINQLQQWSETVCQKNQEIIGIGYFGSYARGDWGVGSDLDLIVIVEKSSLPFEKRNMMFDTTVLPVPVDLLVYTVPEWKQKSEEKGFLTGIGRHLVWLKEPTQ